MVLGGGVPNVPTAAWAGQRQWADVRILHDFRVQQHVESGAHRLLDPRDVRRAAGSYAHCLEVLARLTQRLGAPPPAPHLCVLLSSARARPSMQTLSRGLRAAGLATAPVVHATARLSLEAHATALGAVLGGFAGVERVSFLTYGMGGLIVRLLLARPDLACAEPLWARVHPHRLLVFEAGESAQRWVRAAVGEPEVPLRGHGSYALGPPPIPCGVLMRSLRTGAPGLDVQTLAPAPVMLEEHDLDPEALDEGDLIVLLREALAERAAGGAASKDAILGVARFLTGAAPRC